MQSIRDRILIDGEVMSVGGQFIDPARADWRYAFARKIFAKWVEDTDVAEMCGLTRKEMIDSAEFSDPEEFNRLPAYGWWADPVTMKDAFACADALRDLWLLDVPRAAWAEVAFIANQCGITREELKALIDTFDESTEPRGDSAMCDAKIIRQKPFWMIARVSSAEGSYPQIIGPAIASHGEACKIAENEAMTGPEDSTVVILQAVAMAVESIGIIGLGSCSPIPDEFTESTESPGRASDGVFRSSI